MSALFPGAINRIFADFRKFKTVIGQASAWNRFWRDFLKVWGVPKQTSKKFASEGFRMEISSPRQLLRSLGSLPKTSARTPRNLQELSSHEAGWKILLNFLQNFRKTFRKKPFANDPTSELLILRSNLWTAKKTISCLW